MKKSQPLFRTSPAACRSGSEALASQVRTELAATARGVTDTEPLGCRPVETTLVEELSGLQRLRPAELGGEPFRRRRIGLRIRIRWPRSARTPGSSSV